MLHEGTWSNSSLGGWVNVALSLLLTLLLFTGVYSWGRRFYHSHRRYEVQTSDILVAYASQTGTAEKLARLTATMLQPHQTCSVLPLSAVRVADLQSYRLVLLIVSTTGNGELPQQAKAFVAQLANISLDTLQYALLALGDHHYSQFCQAGLRVQASLDTAHEQAVMDMHMADGEAHPYWQAWLQQVAAYLHIQLELGNDAAKSPAIQLKLQNRVLLNQDVEGVRAVWQLDFKPTTVIEFRPGDLLLYTPPTATQPRYYSVGSSSWAGNIVQLTVGLEKNPTTSHGFGVASQVLCQQLVIGDSISAHIRPHAAFHPVAEPEQKMILIATGTGIASYPGFVQERRLQGSQGQTWLIFGNRAAELDFYYQELWQAALDDGTLWRVDTAFSDTDGQFIQHVISQQATLLYQWLVHDGAHVYICGRQQTVGDGAKEALLQTYQRVGNTDIASAEAWWDDCVSTGQIHMDIFG